jgi:hypothetical protein
VNPAAAILAALAVVLSTKCSTVVREVKQGYFFIESEIYRSQVRITLDKSFIDLYKDKVTIETTFTVDRTNRLAHAAYLDGDLHVAGRAAEIGLPVVAEIQNATLQPGAVETVQRAAYSGAPVRLAGVWRIWSEHFGRAEETQGKTLPRIEKTTPAHVFEVHPVTRIDTLDLAGSFIPVRGFRPEPAAIVFGSLRQTRFRIVPGEKTVTLLTRRQEYNDADFFMELGDDPQQVVSDGRFVYANVLSRRGVRLAERIRMVFVKDTAPEEIVKGLGRGDRLHVFGIPRIDLSAVASRAELARQDPRILEGTLPYEIIVIGVFREKPPRA